MVSVDFYFGPGSRYSYLAATQLPKLVAETGASVRWHSLFSGDLISRIGPDPFAAAQVRGQYAADYRARDVERWARHYQVPYREPEDTQVDWRKIAVWCGAAELLGGAEAFGAWAIRTIFVTGRTPQVEEDFRAGARAARIDFDLLRGKMTNGEGETAYAKTLSNAVAAGAFGVPSFVVEDGELFWGQDRLHLLRDHLMRLAPKHAPR